MLHDNHGVLQRQVPTNSKEKNRHTILNGDGKVAPFGVQLLGSTNFTESDFSRCPRPAHQPLRMCRVCRSMFCKLQSPPSNQPVVNAPSSNQPVVNAREEPNNERSKFQRMSVSNSLMWFACTMRSVPSGCVLLPLAMFLRRRLALMRVSPRHIDLQVRPLDLVRKWPPQSLRQPG